MNQTAGPQGLIPTLLVFGIVPRLPIAPLPLPAQHDRMQAITTSRSDMLSLIAKARVATALATPPPAAAGRDIAPG